MTDYIKRLQNAIRHMHQCDAMHVETVPVREWFQGKVVWDGEVEVFELKDHELASHCYSWSYLDDDDKEQFTAVLKAGPVDSPKAAVRAALVALSKKK